MGSLGDVKATRDELNQSPPLPSLKLNDGNFIPMLAYGTGTANFKTSSEPIDHVIVEAAKNAIQAGFRHLDGAEVYGNEIEMGLAIKTSGVPREELYVATKLWDMTNPKASFELSLRRLGLDSRWFPGSVILTWALVPRADLPEEVCHAEKGLEAFMISSCGLEGWRVGH
ncbi:NAD/NADP-dependent indole-3-acetaldehyde reductase [Colletotrichum fructicola Nara gc5]|uniref:NAD/NADP-dependent indole-3-acetaldehyde reductase n=1 Tax=Colletotrichum fructicola (strain Nara gc5) TaxID=1213859 RepID=A0A7J6IEV0_COLFN|nr:NAD/NADP-dependent indole-3-acetaldehyde reductase [Colletotrichum fructicola Nara gc5]